MRLFWISLISLLGSSMSVEEAKLGFASRLPSTLSHLVFEGPSHQAPNMPHHHLVNMLLGSVP